VPLTSLEDPNVDIITTHHYPFGNDHDFTKPIRAVHALTKGKKPYFVGEFGFVETPHIAAAMQEVIDEGISGALLWSLRMHRREGGFYWHMEVGTGRNIYKAFHWPGFASGDRYDERVVMRLMREKAHEIRGIGLPPLDPPAPPKLLPIERASAISWQGSAGAEAYDVWRAEERGTDNPVRPAVDSSRTTSTDKIVRPTGPWTKIAGDVSDAEVQYRPLFNDEKAEPGARYWYRVTARNSAGESLPSNAIGPVAVECRTLVDECRDVAFLDAIEGNVAIATENARTVQEDCHRLAMHAGSAVVYRVSAPISRARLFFFTRDDAAVPQVSISDDGAEFVPIDTQKQRFDAGQTVYGYLTPLLVAADAVTAGTHLRIAMPASASATPAAVAGTDMSLAPVELSRVEIEYGALQ
jgi:hypothetical protein